MKPVDIHHFSQTHLYSSPCGPRAAELGKPYVHTRSLAPVSPPTWCRCFGHRVGITPCRRPWRHQQVATYRSASFTYHCHRHGVVVEDEPDRRLGSHFFKRVDDLCRQWRHYSRNDSVERCSYQHGEQGPSRLSSRHIFQLRAVGSFEPAARLHYWVTTEMCLGKFAEVRRCRRQKQ